MQNVLARRLRAELRGQGTRARREFAQGTSCRLQIQLLRFTWVVISRVRSMVALLRTLLKGIMTLLATTHESPMNIQVALNLNPKPLLVASRWGKPAALKPLVFSLGFGALG